MTDSPSSDLSGKSVVVTAAGNGIGKAAALAFAKTGANVTVNDIRTDLVEATVAEITQSGGTAHGVTADITKAEAVQSLVDTAVETYGSLDVLFNEGPNALMYLKNLVLV